MIVRSAAWATGLALFAVSTSALAQCPPISPDPLTVMSFDEFRSLSEEYPTHRGEYETTAEFSARREAVSSRMPHSAWVNVPLDLEYVTYSADAQVFEVQKWAVANRNLNYPAIFQGAGVSFPAAYDNFHLVLPSEVVSRDSYIGENAYGARREVTRLSSVTRAIFERPARRGEAIFPRLGNEAAFRVPVPAAVAPEYKHKLRAAALLQPLEPYHVDASDQTRVTMTGARDEAVAYRIVFADIRCIAITDDRNIPLQSRATN